MSTLSVVERILREAAGPMSVRQIVECAGALLPTKSKTPDTVVARDLSMDIKNKGEASLFIRTAPGRYAMREQQDKVQIVGAPTSIRDKVIGESHTRTKPAAQDMSKPIRQQRK